MTLTLLQERALDALRVTMAEVGLDAESPAPGVVVVTLPGEHKLATPCAFVVGEHTVSVNAFVARAPDEHHEQVYRVLLQRNARLSGVAFALDRLGDVYLVGRVPTADLTADRVDALLGAVADAADSMFERLLALGFTTAIRREWTWRRRTGEPVDNLEPFRTLLDLDALDPGESGS